MSRAYSEDLRSRVIREIKKGTTIRTAAKIFGVAPSTAVKWAQRWRTTGSYQAMPQGGNRGSRLDDTREWLLRLVKKEPDLTLMELRDALGRQGVHVGYGTVWRFFEREGISFKKKPVRRRAKAA
jgi:transposase